MPSAAADNTRSNPSAEQDSYYDKIYKSKATPEPKAVGGSGADGAAGGSNRYATSPNSTGGIGITRRLSSAFANSSSTTASAAPTLAGDSNIGIGIGGSAPNTSGNNTTNNAQTTRTMNAPSTGNGSAHSLSLAAGNAPSTSMSTPSKSSAEESRAFLRSESRAYANHSHRASDTLARLQFLLRTNARVVGAILAFAFFVVFVVDDDGTGPTSLRGNL